MRYEVIVFFLRPIISVFFTEVLTRYFNRYISTKETKICKVLTGKKVRIWHLGILERRNSHLFFIKAPYLCTVVFILEILKPILTKYLYVPLDLIYVEKISPSSSTHFIFPLLISVLLVPLEFFEKIGGGKGSK